MACSESAEAKSVRKDEKWNLMWENYNYQRQQWPQTGKHILAHYDEDSVVVYQAFKRTIAKFAIEHQRFGGPDFSFDRMSWVKTNFMWMMYRCGWGTKQNQERVLAVRITKNGFEEILSKAFTIEEQKRNGIQTQDIEVRLQWDPDHDPAGEKEQRRAIQLGLKGKTLQEYSNNYVLNIIDITEEVHRQAKLLRDDGTGAISSPKERIYIPASSRTCQCIGLDFEPQQKVVSFTS